MVIYFENARACVCVCVRECVRACVRACVCVFIYLIPHFALYDSSVFWLKLSVHHLPGMTKRTSVDAVWKATKSIVTIHENFTAASKSFCSGVIVHRLQNF